MNEWLPIETYPKNQSEPPWNKPVLLHQKAEMRGYTAEENATASSTFVAIWEDQHDGTYGWSLLPTGDKIPPHLTPTHWMPLPPLPEA